MAGQLFSGQWHRPPLIDDRAGDDQRRELEAIFGGKSGGHLEGLFGAVITKWLPARFEKIDIQWGDNPSLSVGDIGRVKMQPVKDATGKLTSVAGAAAQAGFQIESMDLASSRSSRWEDPDMRAWDGDSGTLHNFKWSA